MEESHNRKKLRLQDYSYATAGAYFITVCTQNRQQILGTVVGADDHIGPHTRLSAMGKVVAAYTASIPGVDRFVIMPDHVHMILRISAQTQTEGPMWSSAPTKARVDSLIRTWKTLITKKLGQGIWQRSYYDHVIRNEQDYLEITRYIEENPAKWYYRRAD